MEATIWHNPQCGTSRKTLARLQEEENITVNVIEYLKNPPSRETISRLISGAGISAQEAVRTRGTDAEERGLTNPARHADDIIDAIAANPRFLNRPFVETGKGIALCRPMEMVEKLL